MSRETFKIKEGNGKEVELSIRNPQFEDYEESDRVHASKIAELVRQRGSRKLLLRRNLEDFLKEQEIWTDKDQKKVEEIQKEIDGLLNKIRKGGLKASEVRELCIATMDKRKEMVAILRKRQYLDDSTAESVAENERTDYLIYACTVHSDSGKNYWASFEDMKNDKLSDAYRKASTKAVQVIFGVNPEFEKNLPENKLLLKLGYIDQDLNYVDRKTKQKVDREGRPVSELEETAQRNVENLQGDIVTEQPLIDDETGEPILFDQSEQKDIEEAEKEEKEPAEVANE